MASDKRRLFSLGLNELMNNCTSGRLFGKINQYPTHMIKLNESYRQLTMVRTESAVPICIFVLL